MESECKGCKTDGLYGCLNKFDLYESKINPCPCKNCLIKMICVDECEEFLKFGRTLVKEYNGK